MKPTLLTLCLLLLAPCGMAAQSAAIKKTEKAVERFMNDKHVLASAQSAGTSLQEPIKRQTLRDAGGRLTNDYRTLSFCLPKGRTAPLEKLCKTLRDERTQANKFFEKETGENASAGKRTYFETGLGTSVTIGDIKERQDLFILFINPADTMFRYLFVVMFEFDQWGNCVGSVHEHYGPRPGIAKDPTLGKWDGAYNGMEDRYGRPANKYEFLRTFDIYVSALSDRLTDYAKKDRDRDTYRLMIASLTQRIYEFCSEYGRLLGGNSEEAKACYRRLWDVETVMARNGLSQYQAILTSARKNAGWRQW